MKKDTFYRDQLERHRGASIKNYWYAIERMDLMIIYTSLLGIGATLWGAVPDIGGIFFTIALIVNFLSQLTGYWANRSEAKWSSLSIKKERGKEIDNELRKKLDGKSKFYSTLTYACNTVSSISCFLGLMVTAYKFS